MAVDWCCPFCKRSVTGAAEQYGRLCDECSGANAVKERERRRWAMLTLEEKVEELKKRMDALPERNWHNEQIG